HQSGPAGAAVPARPVGPAPEARLPLTGGAERTSCRWRGVKAVEPMRSRPVQKVRSTPKGGAVGGAERCEGRSGGTGAAVRGAERRDGRRCGVLLAATGPAWKG